MPLRPLGRRRQTGKRAVFRPPPDFNALTSLWVNVAAGDDGVTLTLQRDYPAGEFAPAAGWKVDVDGEQYTLTAVDGRQLACGPGGG